MLHPGALAHFDVPAEIVAGDSDGSTPASHAYELQSLLPDARVHLIERCGHQLMLEQPDAINAVIDETIIRCEIAEKSRPLWRPKYTGVRLDKRATGNGNPLRTVGVQPTNQGA